QTGLSPKTFNKVLAELYDAEALNKTKDDEYRVSYELYKEYRDYFENLEPEKKSVPVRVTESEQRDLVSWIDQWRETMGLDFSLKPEHFYLEGGNLNNFSEKLILGAKKEVLVVNPYVDQCDISDSLWKTVSDEKQVILVARKPEDKYEEIKERKEKFHQILREKGVKVVYNSRVHAKLIAVDRAVAVASSMNLQSSSAGGSTWEAGIVTKDDTVVESIVDSIYELVERPESE
ncbi:hypothetical protein EU546_06160, partial [Candidatus Thorarchaeota archaeon]